jgi:hypothetical protein
LLAVKVKVCEKLEIKSKAKANKAKNTKQNKMKLERCENKS